MWNWNSGPALGAYTGLLTTIFLICGFLCRCRKHYNTFSKFTITSWLGHLRPHPLDLEAGLLFPVKDSNDVQLKTIKKKKNPPGVRVLPEEVGVHAGPLTPCY